MNFARALLFASAVASLVGCARNVIPNTDVEDNGANREVVTFLEKYRHAVEDRDVPALTALVSNRYFDDNGTPAGEDDVDYEGLTARLGRWAEGLLAVRYDIRYRRVTYREDSEVLVDFTYAGSFRVRTADGDRWERRLADNRVVLRREGGQYRILSGL